MRAAAVHARLLGRPRQQGLLSLSRGGTVRSMTRALMLCAVVGAWLAGCSQQLMDGPPPRLPPELDELEEIPTENSIKVAMVNRRMVFEENQGQRGLPGEFVADELSYSVSLSAAQASFWIGRVPHLQMNVVGGNPNAIA